MTGQDEAYITKMFKSKNTYLVSTTSRWCENTETETSIQTTCGSSSVEEQILQKCFCTCPTLDGRRDGFCKDFCGRRHELPGDVTQLLYPNKEELNQCKEIKKFEKKALPDVKPCFERFMNKFMPVDANMKIIDIKRQKGNTLTFTTTSKFCETIGSRHDNLMTYAVSKGKIKQMCPVCKKSNPRVHTLTPNIINLLKQ